MKQRIVTMFVLLVSCTMAHSQSGYYVNQAHGLMRDASKVESYYRVADYHNKKAKDHIREVDYNIRNMQESKARDYKRTSGNEPDNARQCLR